MSFICLFQPFYYTIQKIWQALSPAQQPPLAGSLPGAPGSRRFPFFVFPAGGLAISFLRFAPLLPAPGEDASVITTSSVITVYFDYSILLPFLEDLGSVKAEFLSTRPKLYSPDSLCANDASSTVGRPFSLESLTELGSSILALATGTLGL
jgi:hypothetical protein